MRTFEKLNNSEEVAKYSLPH